LERAFEEKLPLESVTENHVNTLYQRWQLPIYLLDLCKLAMLLDALKDRREAMLWAELDNFQ
jgi:hypothetical protein